MKLTKCNFACKTVPQFRIISNIITLAQCERSFESVVHGLPLTKGSLLSW